MNKLSNKFPNVFLTNTHIDLQKSGLSVKESAKSKDKFIIIAQLLEDEDYIIDDEDEDYDYDKDDDRDYNSKLSTYCNKCFTGEKDIKYHYKHGEEDPYLAECLNCGNKWKPGWDIDNPMPDNDVIKYDEDFADTLKEPKSRRRNKDTFERLEDLLSSKSNKNLSVIAQLLTSEDEDPRLEQVDEDIPPIGEDEDPWDIITVNNLARKLKELKK